MSDQTPPPPPSQIPLQIPSSQIPPEAPHQASTTTPPQTPPTTPDKPKLRRVTPPKLSKKGNKSSERLSETTISPVIPDIQPDQN